MGKASTEHVSRDLACTVEIAACEELVAGSTEPEVVDLRVTIICRRESRGGRVVHRYADRLLHPVAGPSGRGTTAQGASSNGGWVPKRSRGSATSGGWPSSPGPTP